MEIKFTFEPKEKGREIFAKNREIYFKPESYYQPGLNPEHNEPKL